MVFLLLITEFATNLTKKVELQDWAVHRKNMIFLDLKYILWALYFSLCLIFFKFVCVCETIIMGNQYESYNITFCYAFYLTSLRYTRIYVVRRWGIEGKYRGRRLSSILLIQVLKKYISIMSRYSQLLMTRKGNSGNFVFFSRFVSQEECDNWWAFTVIDFDKVLTLTV